MRLRDGIVLFLVMLCCSYGKAQSVAVKSNLVYDALLNVNLGAEVGLAPKWTLDLSGDFNAWTLSHGRRWKHWLAQPEARYWLCDRFAGHFFGFHAHGGQYNVVGIGNDTKILGTDFSKLSDHRYQGWFVGAGVAYGYAWILSKHWNLEGEIGVGYSYTRYDKFDRYDCGKKEETDRTHNYVGLTKAALNLVYVF